MTCTVAASGTKKCEYKKFRMKRANASNRKFIAVCNGLSKRPRHVSQAWEQLSVKSCHGYQSCRPQAVRKVNTLFASCVERYFTGTGGGGENQAILDAGHIRCQGCRAYWSQLTGCYGGHCLELPTTASQQLICQSRNVGSTAGIGTTGLLVTKPDTVQRYYILLRTDAGQQLFHNDHILPEKPLETPTYNLTTKCLGNKRNRLHPCLRVYCRT